jgi:photosystem II stability/assembly factor-like uncharacterized protein
MRSSDRSRHRGRRSTTGMPTPPIMAITAAIGFFAIFGIARLQSPAVDAPSGTTDSIAASSIASSAGQARIHPTGFFNGWFVTPKVGWSVTTSGPGGAALSRTVDGGVHWTPELALAYPHLLERDMSFVDQNNGFAAMGVPTSGHLESRLMATTDGGDHWTARNLPSGLVAGLDFASPTRGWALTGQTPKTALYRTDDGGATWRACAKPVVLGVDGSQIHLEGVRFATGRLGWVAGWVTSTPAAKVFYLTTNDGCNTWQTSWLALAPQSSDATEVMYVDLPQFVAGRFASAVVTRDLSTGFFQLSNLSSAIGTSAWTLDGSSDRSRTLPAWIPVGNVRSAVITNGTVSVGLPSSPNVGIGAAVVAIQFVDSTTGFAEVTQGATTRLMTTHNGGSSWTLVVEGK